MDETPDLQKLLGELISAIGEYSRGNDALLNAETIRRLLREHPELARMVSDRWAG